MAFIHNQSLTDYINAIKAILITDEVGLEFDSIKNTEIEPIPTLSELVILLQESPYEQWWISINQVNINLRKGWANPYNSERIIPVVITGYITRPTHPESYNRAAIITENILAAIGEYITLQTIHNLDKYEEVIMNTNNPANKTEQFVSCVLEDFSAQWGRTRIDTADNIRLMKAIISFQIRDLIRYTDGRRK